MLKSSKSKFSFHESGQFHIKKLRNNQYSGTYEVENWENKHETKLVFRIITLPFYKYPLERKKLTRDNSFARSILLKGESSKNRIFAEFFLTRIPENRELKLPEFSIIVDADKLLIHYFPLNSEYFLVMRYIKLDNLDFWHPETEVVILPNNKKIEDL